MIVRLGWVGRRRLLLFVLAALIASNDGGRAQTAPVSPTLGLQEQGSPQGTPPASPPPAAPTHEDNPGLLNEMGREMSKLFDKILPLKKSGESAGEAGKDGGNSSLDTLSRLAKPSSMVLGREACPAAGNGTPDCQSGAVKLCQTKGYKDGKSLNTDSAEHCSAKVLIPGRTRKPDDCRTDTFVTSALCQ